MRVFINNNFHKHFGLMLTRITRAFEGDVWIQYDLQIFLWSKCVTLNYKRYIYLMSLEQKIRLKSLINKPRSVQ